MIEPERLITLAEEMEGPLERMLKWKQVCERYERGKHSKLASIVARLRILNGNASQAKLDSLAYGDPEYEEFLKEWNHAEEEMVKARVKFDTLRCAWESLQSVIAYMREGMKRGIL